MFGISFLLELTIIRVVVPGKGPIRMPFILVISSPLDEPNADLISPLVSTFMGF